MSRYRVPSSQLVDPSLAVCRNRWEKVVLGSGKCSDSYTWSVSDQDSEQRVVGALLANGL